MRRLDSIKAPSLTGLELALYVEAYPDAPLERRAFTVVNIGDPVPEGADFVGSYLVYGLACFMYLAWEPVQ